MIINGHLLGAPSELRRVEIALTDDAQSKLDAFRTFFSDPD
jgi:hypothetical protein